MYTYDLLEPDCYYIIQEKENDRRLTLLQVKVVGDSCMYVVKYGDDIITEWKRKTDTIHDIIELLDDSAVKKWTDVYFNSEDAYNYEEDEE
ncbi:MAG TPA: hypothetical protein VHB48_17615 [Chitinophagaceae bacterium]|jgi:hypothetical protein|nr:hypothetical protein [Chitinophagaceae bacterium]